MLKFPGFIGRDNTRGSYRKLILGQEVLTDNNIDFLDTRL